MQAKSLEEPGLLTRRKRRSPMGVTLLLASTWLAVAATAPGCGTPRSHAEPDPPTGMAEDLIAQIPSGPDAVYSSDGLVRVPAGSTTTAQLFIKPPRPHLQRFDSMVLVPPVIEYKDARQPWSKRREEGLRAHFRAELLAEIGRDEFWTLAPRVSENTIVIRATIADFAPGFQDEIPSGSATSLVTAGGGAVLGFELFDPRDRTPLMRYVERYQLPGGYFSGGDIDEQRMRLVIARFARHLGRALRLHYRAIKDIGEHESTGS